MWKEFLFFTGGRSFFIVKLICGGLVIACFFLWQNANGGNGDLILRGDYAWNAFLTFAGLLAIEVLLYSSGCLFYEIRQTTQSTLAAIPISGSRILLEKAGGCLIAIIPTADRQKATVKVRVGFDQLDPRILPEMGVKVAFHNAEAATQKPARGSIAIPKSALQQVDGRDVVWVLRDGRVERRAVTVAQTDGSETTISAGVTGGENVVVDPPPGLTDGARVVEKKP